MDNSGFSSPSVRTIENNPRQRNAADSLPSLSQLKALYEEAVLEETAPPPAPEPAAEYREPTPDRAAPALRADIPTLSQLNALRSEDALERERPSRREEDRKVTAADIPTLSQLSFLREEAETAEREPQWEPRRERRWETRGEPRWEPQREPQWESRREARQEPERESRWEPRGEARPEPQWEPRRAPEYVREEPEEPSRPSRAFTAADIPSLTSLQSARETADRDEYDFDETPLREEFDAPVRSRGPESRADSLPTVAQLRAQLEEEKLYGNLAFQDSVRQIKQVLKEPASAPQPAEQPAPRTAQPRQPAAIQPTAPQPVPQRAAAPQPAPQQTAAPQKPEAGQRVHFIPYEDFLKEEDFDDFTSSGKNGEGPSRFGGKPRSNPEAEAKEFKQKMAGSQRQRREEAADSAKQDAQLKKKRDPKILYWINSLRRTS